ncbi:response regulator [Oligoflexia bacterium]|nr:response regulator [Oligoflexia bacterium]
MPDLLVYCNDNESIFQLEQLGKEHGFRVKSTVTFKTALDWLNLRSFDVACVNAEVDIAEQQTIAGLLWENSLETPFVVFDLNKESKIDVRGIRLFGADLAFGEGAAQKLGVILADAKDSIATKYSDFQVMVVEDLDSPRDIICLYVEKMGFPNVVGFRSGKEALVELKAKPKSYSCVITDMRMPEVTGEELIRRVRANALLQHIPIIVLTAYGTVDALTDCLKAGASGFLVKPPKKQGLMRELARAMRIVKSKRDPRLAHPDEADDIREILLKRGIG